MPATRARPRVVRGIIFATILIDFLGFSLLVGNAAGCLYMAMFWGGRVIDGWKKAKAE